MTKQNQHVKAIIEDCLINHVKGGFEKYNKSYSAMDVCPIHFQLILEIE